MCVRLFIWNDMATSRDEYIGTLDANSLKRAREELHEDDKNRAGAVETLRQWAEQQKWLKTPTDNKFLLRFLRAKKYSQLEARKSLEAFWKARNSNPGWFLNKDTREPKIQDVFSKGFMVRLPRVDKEGRTYFIQRPGIIDPSYIKNELGPDAIFRTVTSLLDWMTMDERTQVNGVVVIIDLTGYTLQHKMCIHTLENMKRFFPIINNNPIRMKGLHLYNMPPLFEAVLTLAKTFAKEKLKNRIHPHGRSLVSLYEMIDMSVLPKEYLPDDYTGPNSGTLDEIIESTKSGISQLEVVNYIKSLTTGDYGVNLELKPQNEDNPAASFRKLNID